MSNYEDPHTRTTAGLRTYPVWIHWPVNWSAIWTGALAAVASLFLFGLAGTAVGAHLLGPDNRIVDLKKTGLETLVFSVCAAFFSFVIGGWIAGRIAGTRRSEHAALHGAIVWLVATPLLITLIMLGAGGLIGGWYSGLNGSALNPAAPFERPTPIAADASAESRRQYNSSYAQYREKMQKWREDAPRAARNSALGAMSAMLLGLMGGVIGGWVAAGEPMTFTHHRRRQEFASVR